jgi:hypothetical protein
MRLDRRFLLAAGVASAVTSMLPAGHARAADDRPARAGEDRPTYLMLATLTIPVIRPGQSQGQLTVSAQLELTDARLELFARRNMPRLHNDVLVELAELIARTPSSAPMPGVDRIRRRIQVGAERMLGEGTVKAVHLRGQSVHFTS